MQSSRCGYVCADNIAVSSALACIVAALEKWIQALCLLLLHVQVDLLDGQMIHWLHRAFCRDLWDSRDSASCKTAVSKVRQAACQGSHNEQSRICCSCMYATCLNRTVSPEAMINRSSDIVVACHTFFWAHHRHSAGPEPCLLPGASPLLKSAGIGRRAQRQRLRFREPKSYSSAWKRGRLLDQSVCSPL